MENSVFFAKPENLRALKEFESQIDSLPATDPFEKPRNKYIKKIVQSISSSPGLWDELCQINIGWIGDKLIAKISREEKDWTKDELDTIFAFLYRLLLEVYLSAKEDLSAGLESARKFASQQLGNFELDARDQIQFAAHDMPISLLKRLVQSSAIENIKDFNKISSSADAMREDWDRDLSEREQRVNALRSALDSYQSAFNFVGLYDGFNELSEQKLKEKKYLVVLLVVFGLLILSPLAIELTVLYKNLAELEKIKNVLILSIVPTISLVAIFIYFFRVVLYNYKSVKSQLLQIDLRKTLCRFIQHYAEYSSKLKEKDKDSLVKFENIVFSGIVSDEGKLPSTYDGIERLANLIKSAKAP